MNEPALFHYLNSATENLRSNAHPVEVCPGGKVTGIELNVVLSAFKVVVKERRKHNSMNRDDLYPHVQGRRNRERERCRPMQRVGKNRHT